MILTNKELYDLNSRMLNLGAPVEIDNVGYNKVDFDRMRYMSTKQPVSMTKFDAYKIADALVRYSNTQLLEYKSQIIETRTALYDVLKTVTVIETTNEHVQINWNYNEKVSAFIRSMDRASFKWIKTSIWILQIDWNYIDGLLTVLEENGFDVTALQETKKKLDSGETINGLAVPVKKPELTPVGTYKIHITREKDTVDTLSIITDYNKSLISVISSITNTYYVSANKSWSFYIEDSAKMYNVLKNCGIKVDLSELEPWNNLVKKWNTSYKLKEFTGLKFKPYGFQFPDSQTMMDHHVMINGNEMGCGKTFEDVIMGESIPLPKLVICPASLRLNWEREILMVNPKAKITILYDNSKFSTNDWTIIGYPSVSKHLENLEKKMLQVIFADEAHYCQAINNSGDPDSKRALAVLRLTATSNYVIPTTGTPKTNRNKNLFNILRMIRHPLTRGKWAFQNYGVEYCDGQRSSWGWDYEGNSNDDKLFDEINPNMVRHLKKDVLPNLKKMRHVIPVSVDLREYNEVIAEYLNSRTNKEAEQLARLMRARKILATQKVGETIDFAKEFIENGDKIIIVTCFTEVIKILEKSFSGNCVKIVGGMSDKQKEDSIAEFQTGSTKVMLLNIIAGGVGITLTASHNMILNDYDWTPGNVVQVEDRICRGGQIADCSDIYYITAKGADVEEDFVDMLTYKSDTINAAIDNGTGDSINFRSLLERTAGRTRSDKLRKILESDKVKPVVKPIKDTPKTSSVSVASSKQKTTTDWKKFTTDELEAKLNNLGGSYVSCSNSGINRMRIIMSLKKLTA